MPLTSLIASVEMSDVVIPPLPPKTRRPPLAQDQTVLPTSSVNSGTVEIFSNLSYIEHAASEDKPNHVVKILINPQTQQEPCIRINVNSEEMVRNMNDTLHHHHYFYGLTSGQVSPSDTLDSGTCSDLEQATPPPLPKKKNGVSVTLIGHKRAPSSSSGVEADSDDNESSISCDSLNSGQASPEVAGLLPQLLLQDIRKRSLPPEGLLQLDRKPPYPEDMFYEFHLNEHIDAKPKQTLPAGPADDSFAGYQDILNRDVSTIKSARGTVRGVKNRVRNGIATFQSHPVIRNFKEKDGGKVVVYTTTMGILRETYQSCSKVKQILRTLMVKFEERDLFMSSEYQQEIRERMRCDDILVPQVFVDGQHIGDAETVERLNESGELRRILKPYKSADVCSTCQHCGGYRLLPCQVCNGSKKSVHRNHFTTEFVALKCMNCDEAGLVRCTFCS